MIEVFQRLARSRSPHPSELSESPTFDTCERPRLVLPGVASASALGASLAVLSVVLVRDGLFVRETGSPVTASTLTG